MDSRPSLESIGRELEEMLNGKAEPYRTSGGTAANKGAVSQPQYLSPLQSIFRSLHRWCSKRSQRAPDLPAPVLISQSLSAHRSHHATQTGRVRRAAGRLQLKQHS